MDTAEVVRKFEFVRKGTCAFKDLERSEILFSQLLGRPCSPDVFGQDENIGADRELRMWDAFSVGLFLITLLCIQNFVSEEGVELI